MPSISGMRTSISTTSGSRPSIITRACAPLGAWPTTVISSVSSSIARDSRNPSLSSTSRTRTRGAVDGRVARLAGKATSLMREVSARTAYGGIQPTPGSPRGTRPRISGPEGLGRPGHGGPGGPSSVEVHGSARGRCYALRRRSRRVPTKVPAGSARVEEARDRRPACIRPGARTASAGQGRNGCAISREARRAARVAARAPTPPQHRAARALCACGPAVASTPAPARPLASTERSNRGSRDRGRGPSADRPARRRAHRRVQARGPPAQAGDPEEAAGHAIVQDDEGPTARLHRPRHRRRPRPPRADIVQTSPSRQGQDGGSREGDPGAHREVDRAARGPSLGRGSGVGPIRRPSSPATRRPRPGSERWRCNGHRRQRRCRRHRGTERPALTSTKRPPRPRDRPARLDRLHPALPSRVRRRHPTPTTRPRRRRAHRASGVAAAAGEEAGGRVDPRVRDRRGRSRPVARGADRRFPAR